MTSLLRLTLYIGFLTIGAVSSLMGAALPSIRTSLGINYSQSGLILSGQFLGMCLTAIIGGYLADRLGKKPLLIAGSIFLATGLLGSMASYSFTSLFIWNIIAGVGFGIYEVGINALCSDFCDSNKGNAMNRLHFFFGVGAILAPILVTASSKSLLGWRACFGICAVLPLIVGIMLFRIKVNENAKEKKSYFGTAYRNLFIWLAGASIFIYVGIETSVYGWIPALWEKLSPGGLIPPTLVTTFFWVSLTIARLFTGKIADYMGFGRYLTASGIAGVAAAFILLISPSDIAVLICIILLGFILAGIFPTVMASATSHFPEQSGMVTAFISVFSALGGVLIPTQIGYFADIFTVEVIPQIIFAASALMLAFIFTGWHIVKVPSARK
ncbi:fucose permease [Anaerobacterium chartisolvens]|uniref:Fucose permease n=1 Tax=Anaerobacterium chartisolvens TaxID=1297424 RepID=A0A369ALB3_9FIRM|nr:MFS transporter [Anaerobacterium chartisolvens]RCX09076.1 fucose permease [Anaerobacterium chartisolvens]